MTQKEELQLHGDTKEKKKWKKATHTMHLKLFRWNVLILTNQEKKYPVKLSTNKQTPKEEKDSLIFFYCSTILLWFKILLSCYRLRLLIWAKTTSSVNKHLLSLVGGLHSPSPAQPRGFWHKQASLLITPHLSTGGRQFCGQRLQCPASKASPKLDVLDWHRRRHLGSHRSCKTHTSTSLTEMCCGWHFQWEQTA